MNTPFPPPPPHQKKNQLRIHSTPKPEANTPRTLALRKSEAMNTNLFKIYMHEYTCVNCLFIAIDSLNVPTQPAGQDCPSKSAS